MHILLMTYFTWQLYNAIDIRHKEDKYDMQNKNKIRGWLHRITIG